MARPGAGRLAQGCPPLVPRPAPVHSRIRGASGCGNTSGGVRMYRTAIDRGVVKGEAAARIVSAWRVLTPAEKAEVIAAFVRETLAEVVEGEA